MKKFVVMISGANRGIGLAVAKLLFKEPQYYLSLGIRNVADFDFEQHFSDDKRVMVNHYDATQPGTSKAWLQLTLERFGQVDGLVNNAGILRSCGIENYDEKNFDDMWQVNTKAPIELTEQAWNHLKVSGQSRVINIVSIAGKTTREDEFGYNLTKHALLAFTHSIRKAGWDHGIRATAICPGWVNTDMAATSEYCNMAPADMTQAEDIAKLVQTAIEIPNNASLGEIVVTAHCAAFP